MDYAHARNSYQTAMKYWALGKLDLLGAILESERLANSELALCRTTEHEIDAISGHLSRAARSGRNREGLAR